MKGVASLNRQKILPLGETLSVSLSLFSERTSRSKRKKEKKKTKHVSFDLNQSLFKTQSLFALEITQTCSELDPSYLESETTISSLSPHLDHVRFKKPLRHAAQSKSDVDISRFIPSSSLKHVAAIASSFDFESDE